MELSSVELRSSGTQEQPYCGSSYCLPAGWLDTGWRWLARVWEDGGMVAVAEAVAVGVVGVGVARSAGAQGERNEFQWTR